MCPSQAASWPIALGKEDLGALGQEGISMGMGSPGQLLLVVVLAPCVFVLSCPAQAFPVSSC